MGNSGKTFAIYPSSLFAQNFSEGYNFNDNGEKRSHGYVLWDLKNDNYEYKEIENTYRAKYNIYIYKDFDYDNIDFKFSHDLTSFKEVELKIHWFDYSSNINVENQNKIEYYLNNKLDNIVSIKYNRKPIEIGINNINEDNQDDNNVIDVTNPEVQKDKIKKWLEENDYDEEFINKVLEIDDLINQRLNINNITSNEWKLHKLHIDNFRIIHDTVDINFSGKEGLWQITGENYVGKTTIFNAISYLNYGTDLSSPTNREKHGDRRYINRRNNKNYCLVSGIYNINGTFYEIERKTVKELTKKNTIKSVQTNVQYFELDNNFNRIENKNEEQSNKTQKIIEEHLGNFDDFLRNNLVNSDTLNNLLTAKESEFTDAILKDSGMGIFMDKLEEFKVYEKEKIDKEERIQLNISEENDKIKNHKNQIKEKQTEKKQYKKNKQQTEKIIENLEKEKDKLSASLKPVDEESLLVHREDLVQETNDKNEEKTKLKDYEKGINQQIDNLPNNYNKERYDELVNLIEEKNNNLYKIKENSVNNIKPKQNDYDSKISEGNGNITLIDKEIKSLDDSYKEKSNNFTKEVTERKNVLENDFNSKIENINNSIKILEDHNKKLDQEKTCGVCGEKLPDEYIKETINKLKENKSKIEEKNKELEKTKKEKERQIQNVESELRSKLNKELNQIETDKQNKEKERNKIIENINIYKQEYNKLDEELKNKREEYKNIQKELDKYEEEKKKIETEKEQYEKRKELEKDKENVPIKIENIDNKLKELRRKIENYDKANENKEYNKSIEEKIKSKKDEIITKRNGINEINDTINKIYYDIENFQKEINNIHDRIEKFKEQEKYKEIFKVYKKCLSRDNLPKQLLIQSKDLINTYLMSLLSEVHFCLYFDDDFSLKVYFYDNPNDVQSAIECSGMERTMIAVALRYVLRKINNKTKGNIILLDEVMNKLVNDSIDKFINLINAMKKDVDHLFIIEHAYSNELQPDNLIEVHIDENQKTEVDVL